MNWKLVLSLSLFGLAMGIATAFVVPATIEPIFSLATLILCAIVIAKRSTTKHFLYGRFVSLANTVWITASRGAT
jgi:hypothetical protein